MEAKRLVDTVSKSLPNFEVKTLFCKLTDSLNEVGVERLGFTLAKEKGKVLFDTLARNE